MKTIIYFVAIICLVCFSANAQVSYVKDNNLKFDSSTNCQMRYVYFPNMCAYFDKLEKVYLFKENGEWKKAEDLPTLFGGYSLYSQVGVEIKDYDEENPQTQIKKHKKQFPFCSKGRFTYETVAVRN